MKKQKELHGLCKRFPHIPPDNYGRRRFYEVLAYKAELRAEKARFSTFRRLSAHFRRRPRSLQRRVWPVIVMREFSGAVHHLCLLLLLLTAIPSKSFPADVGTGRLLALDSDIAEVQERWRQYRNLVTDGFFLNDSMIVLADFFNGQQKELENQEGNSDDYHHYFSFQDYLTENGNPSNVIGEATGEYNAEPENNYDIEDNAAKKDNKLNENTVVAEVISNEAKINLSDNPDILSDVTERTVGLSELINDRILNEPQTAGAKVEQMEIMVYNGAGGQDDDHGDQGSKMAEARLDPVEEGEVGLEDDEEGIAGKLVVEEAEVDGKGLEQVILWSG